MDGEQQQQTKTKDVGHEDGPDGPDEQQPRTPAADAEPRSPFDVTDDAAAENDGPAYDASSSSGNLDGGDDDDDASNDPYTDVSSMSSDAAASLAELEVRRAASLSQHGDRPLDGSNRSSASDLMRPQGGGRSSDPPPPVGLSFSRSGSQGSMDRPPQPPQTMAQEPGSPASHHRRQHSFALRFYDSEDEGSRAGSLVFVENSPAGGRHSPAPAMIGASPSAEGNRARTGSAGSVGLHSASSRPLGAPVPLTRVRSTDRVMSSGERQTSPRAFPRFYDSEDDGPGSLVFTPSHEGGAPQHGQLGHQLIPIQRSFSSDDGQLCTPR